MDNLDSHTYEVFEKDPIKYKEYERVSYDYLSLTLLLLLLLLY